MSSDLEKGQLALQLAHLQEAYTETEEAYLEELNKERRTDLFPTERVKELHNEYVRAKTALGNKLIEVWKEKKIEIHFL
jgi:hypothetical protein